MAWENEGRYYTRSVRERGRIKREYLGCGETAQVIARMDALDRGRRDDERYERRAARSEDAEASRLVRWYCGAVEDVLKSELTAQGYRRHQRGEWRKQRRKGTHGMETETEIQKAARAEQGRRRKLNSQIVLATDRELTIRSASVPETLAERRAVIMAAINGDTAAEAQALACIRAHPVEVVLGWGSPRMPCIDLVCPSDATGQGRVVRAVVEEEFKYMMDSILGPTGTPLERLLAERITVLRMQITHFERAYESRLKEGSMALELSDHHMKRIERLTKLLLRAVVSLAKVRKLQLPAVNVGQVNIGDQQVNVAG